MPNSSIHISAGPIQAAIATRGAELTAFDAAGVPLLWPGEATSWANSSPLLFPFIGRPASGTVGFGDRRYPMPLHGFVGDLDFEVVSVSGDSAVFSIRDSEHTRQFHPFAFELVATYRMTPKSLLLDLAVVNTGQEDLPFQIGLHPGFRRPVFDGDDASRYRLAFSRPLPVAFMDRDFRGAPLVDFELDARTLDGRAHLFAEAEGATVSYLRNGKPLLDLSSYGLAHLAIWAKEGAAFVCIEPWQGLPEPARFADIFARKAGVVTLAPGRTYRAGMTITVHAETIAMGAS